MTAIENLRANVNFVTKYGRGWGDLVAAAQAVTNHLPSTDDFKKSVTHTVRTGHGLGVVLTNAQKFLASA